MCIRDRALETKWITGRQIEAARIAVTRYWLLFGKGEMVRDHMSTQPDLFSNTAINPSGGQAALEYRKMCIRDRARN